MIDRNFYKLALLFIKHNCTDTIHFPASEIVFPYSSACGTEENKQNIKLKIKKNNSSMNGKNLHQTNNMMLQRTKNSETNLAAPLATVMLGN